MLLQRKPTMPGEILNEEFLKPMKMTQRRIADYLGCDVKVINRIINGRTSVTAEMAIRMSAAFGTSVEFWLNAQQAVDIYEATKKVGKQRPKPLLKAS
jgi:addiction module HigA family antidote